MFQFNLPKWALLPVTTPEGTTQPMVHMGDGVFLSPLPPVALNTCLPIGEPATEGLQPVSWNSTALGADVNVAQVLFDAAAAAEALRLAAEAGDVMAITTQARIKAVAKEAGLVMPGH